MAKANKGIENLKPMKKGETRNPNGRPPLLKNAIKNLPPNMREEVMGVLSHVLTLQDEEEAKKYLECKKGELGQYGFVIQIAIKQMLKEGYGFGATMQIMDRLYGRPRESAEITHKADGLTIVVNNKSEEKKLSTMKKLDI